MKSVSLSGSLRTNVGKKDAAALRKSGNVPCVIYGGKEQIHFTAKELDLSKMIWSSDAYEVKLTVGGKDHRAIVQDIQFHPVNDRLVHVDFLEIAEDKKVKFQIPVKLTGAAEGVKKGGRLIQNFRKLTVLGLPKHLPDTIDVAIDHLNIGDGVRVRELKVEGLTFLDNASSYVVSVQVTRNVEEPAAAAATPAASATPAAAPAAPAAKAPEKKK
ncbi:MAG TPA: 50S ribosomal protein L25/general stress protein Ctc [Flavobacteriales bacterium]|nr:50S ribosomal protein L25/general stress protein Ctc [Flavobacteriales bacterium]